MRIAGWILIALGAVSALAGSLGDDARGSLQLGVAFLVGHQIWHGARARALSRLAVDAEMALTPGESVFRPLGFPALALYDGPCTPRVRDLMQGRHRGGKLAIFDDMSTEYEVALSPSETVVIFEHEALPRFRFVIQPRWGFSGGRRGNPTFVEVETGDAAFDRRYCVRFAEARDAEGFPTAAQRADLLGRRGLTVDGRAGLIALYRAGRPVTALGRARLLRECQAVIDRFLPAA